MRIVVSRIIMSLGLLLAASTLPAQAQSASDPALIANGISTSHLPYASSGRYGSRSYGYSRRSAYRYSQRTSRRYAPRYTQRYTPRFTQRSAPRFAQRHTHRHSHSGGAGTSRACLTADTRSVLAGLEARFGGVKVISTCRPGAVIAGSGRPSQHRYGKAVDFMPNPGQRAAVMSWLRANANGAVITYASGHIHFDTGGYRNFSVSAKARRSYARGR